MDDDAQSGVHEVTAADVPDDAWWLHYAALRTWPMHMAAAWAAFPSRGEIIAQGKRLTGFPREQQARTDMMAELISGRLVAYGKPEPGYPWDPAVEIPAERWRRMRLREARSGGLTLCESAFNLDGGDVAFREVEVETSRLFGIWPDPETILAPETPIDVEYEEVEPERPKQEVIVLPSIPTRQDVINEIAAKMPDGFRWETGSSNKELGSPGDYPFYRELEKRFDGQLSRDKEARPAWESHYRFKPKRGRPRKPEQK